MVTKSGGIVGVRMTEQEVRTLDQLAERLGVDRSKALRWLLATSDVGRVRPRDPTAPGEAR